MSRGTAVQPLSDPPAARELAQFLDPDGAACSFRLERTGGEATAHPAGRFGRAAVVFLGVICVVIVAVSVVQAVAWWVGGIQRVMALLLAVSMVVSVPVAAWYIVRVLRWMDRFQLVHGPFARWDAPAGTVELPRLGVTLHRDQLLGAVCLTGGECCGGWVRWGAWCLLREGVPERATRPGNGWTQLSELTLIAQGADGTLARYPLVTAENPWRFREFAECFAAEFGLPLQLIVLDRRRRRELRALGWRDAGEFADADRPRKVAAGRVAVSDGNFPGFGNVVLGGRTTAGSTHSGFRRGQTASTI